MKILEDMSCKLLDDLMKTVDRTVGLLDNSNDKRDVLLLVSVAVLDSLALLESKGKTKPLGPRPQDAASITFNEFRRAILTDILLVAINHDRHKIGLG